MPPPSSRRRQSPARPAPPLPLAGSRGAPCIPASAVHAAGRLSSPTSCAAFEQPGRQIRRHLGIRSSVIIVFGPSCKTSSGLSIATCWSRMRRNPARARRPPLASPAAPAVAISSTSPASRSRSTSGSECRPSGHSSPPAGPCTAAPPGTVVASPTPPTAPATSSLIVLSGQKCASAAAVSADRARPSP